MSYNEINFENESEFSIQNIDLINVEIVHNGVISSHPKLFALKGVYFHFM